MYILRTSIEVVAILIHLPTFLIIPTQKNYRRGNIVSDGQVRLPDDIKIPFEGYKCSKILSFPISIFEKAKSFLPKSLIEAPIW